VKRKGRIKKIFLAGHCWGGGTPRPSELPKIFRRGAASPYHPSTRLSCQKTVKTNHGLLYKIMDFLRKTIDSPVEIWHNIKDNNKRGDGPK